MRYLSLILLTLILCITAVGCGTGGSSKPPGPNETNF